MQLLPQLTTPIVDPTRPIDGWAGSMRAHMSTEEILDDIRLRIESMPLECGPGVTIPALPPVDRHNPPKVKVYGGWKQFIMHVVLAQEASKSSRRLATRDRFTF